MLDFGVLTEKIENFRRVIETFHIKDALNFIREIFDPKITSKLIKFTISYEGF